MLQIPEHFEKKQLRASSFSGPGFRRETLARIIRNNNREAMLYGMEKDFTITLLILWKKMLQ